MGRIFHLATVVVDGQFGMVVLAMGYPGDHIHECDGLEVVLEVKGFADQVVVLLPAIKLLQKTVDVRLGQRRHAGFAGFASSVGQVA